LFILYRWWLEHYSGCSLVCFLFRHKYLFFIIVFLQKCRFLDRWRYKCVAFNLFALLWFECVVFI
jgi:hypothetical protein